MAAPVTPAQVVQEHPVKEMRVVPVSLAILVIVEVVVAQAVQALM